MVVYAGEALIEGTKSHVKVFNLHLNQVEMYVGLNKSILYKIIVQEDSRPARIFSLDVFVHGC